MCLGYVCLGFDVSGVVKRTNYSFRYFLNDLLTGQGVFEGADGSYYSGSWSYGLRNGSGISK